MVCSFLQGSKDPNNRVLGPNSYQVNNIWALKPCYLGPWTLGVKFFGSEMTRGMGCRLSDLGIPVVLTFAHQSHECLKNPVCHVMLPASLHVGFWQQMHLQGRESVCARALLKIELPKVHEKCGN